MAVASGPALRTSSRTVLLLQLLMAGVALSQVSPQPQAQAQAQAALHGTSIPTHTVLRVVAIPAAAAAAAAAHMVAVVAAMVELAAEEMVNGAMASMFLDLLIQSLSVNFLVCQTTRTSNKLASTSPTTKTFQSRPLVRMFLIRFYPLQTLHSTTTSSKTFASLITPFLLLSRSTPFLSSALVVI